jgi:c-di-GMP-binding flagellar brake protein YcgR
MENERRRYKRYDIHQMIKMSLTKKEEVYNAKGINISKSGLLCETEQKIFVGTMIYLLITIPSIDKEIKIEIQAKCVRLETIETDKKFRIAMEFDHIEENSKKALFEYIDNELDN